MAVFQFRGVATTSGKEVRGVRDADSPKNLRVALRREGIVLTSATEAKAATAKKSREIQLFAFLQKPSIGDVAVTTRQLATLVRAGIPLTDAIGALTEQVEKVELKRILASVRELVNEGTAFANALAEHPTVFPPLYVNMVAAGEASGTLESVLDRLANFMDAQARLRGKVMGAMAYPILMLIIGSILLSVLMIGVVPKVTAIFATLDRALPWYTQVLIGVSGAFVSPISHAILCGTLIGTAGYLVIYKPLPSVRPGVVATAPKKQGTGPSVMLTIGIVVAVMEVLSRETAMGFIVALFPGMLCGVVLGNFMAWLRTDKGRVAKDGFYLRLPIFGPLIQMIAVSRFADTLATLLSSGVQLLRAMDIVRAVIGNAALELVVEEAASAIREGESIAEPLRRSKQFPPIVTHMIAVGEKSGQLEQMLEQVSKSYESAIETRVTAMTSILEPLTIVIMGGMIGFIAFSILMPLIQMNDFNQ